MSKAKTAQYLTYAGAIPFYVLSVLATGIWGDPERALTLLLSYGAIIVSFIAGIHWGAYLFKGAPLNLFIHSNIFALIAWGAVWTGGIEGIGLLVICLVYLLFIDYVLSKANVIEAWYFRLRKNITALVLGAMVLCLGAVY